MGPASISTASPARALLDRLRPYAPWGSLALGLFGALMMDRRPERAGLVAGASIGGWVALALLTSLRRAGDAPLGRRRALALRVARLSTMTASAWALQLSLFFSLPFFARASAWLPGHVAFLAVLAAASALTLWDPLLSRVLAHPWAALGLQAVASFAALAAVLPVLGLSNRASLWAAAALTGAALPLVRSVGPGASGRETLRALAVALLAPAALAVGAARLIPAAPLRLVGEAIGTGLRERAAVGPLEEQAERPAQLVCSSTIAAPRGLKDELFHVWRKDGWPVDRIALVVEGGRGIGYRTYSIKRNLGRSPEGRWTCAVETASGQLLGEREATLPALPESPSPPERGAPAEAAANASPRPAEPSARAPPPPEPPAAARAGSPAGPKPSADLPAGAPAGTPPFPPTPEEPRAAAPAGVPPVAQEPAGSPVAEPARALPAAERRAAASVGGAPGGEAPAEPSAAAPSETPTPTPEPSPAPGAGPPSPSP